MKNWLKEHAYFLQNCALGTKNLKKWLTVEFNDDSFCDRWNQESIGSSTD